MRLRYVLLGLASVSASVLLAACVPVPPTTSAPAATPSATQAVVAYSGVMTGTITYLVRSALPDDATVQVMLVDVSRADAPAKVLAEQNIVTGGTQVPIPFDLDYDPAAIDPRFIYAVQARIEAGGQLRFITKQVYPVLTRGNPATGIEVLVEPIG